MTITEIIHKLKHELKALAGKEGKDKEFCSENTYSTETGAKAAFENSRRKLFDVNSWSELDGINSTFTLYDSHGNEINGKVETGHFIKIILPGAKVENWVRIHDVKNEENMAYFIVHPSRKPEEKYNINAEVKHFFTSDASSTFVIQRNENTITACEIGRNEMINNSGDEAGERALLNTLIAEGGWAGFQAIQWGKLTRFLVHLNGN